MFSGKSFETGKDTQQKAQCCDPDREKSISASTIEYRTEKGNSTPNFCPSAFIVKKPQEDGHCDILKAPLACLASAWIQEKLGPISHDG